MHLFSTKLSLLRHILGKQTEKWSSQQQQQQELSLCLDLSALPQIKSRKTERKKRTLSLRMEWPAGVMGGEEDLLLCSSLPSLNSSSRTVPWLAARRRVLWKRRRWSACPSAKGLFSLSSLPVWWDLSRGGGEKGQ